MAETRLPVTVLLVDFADDLGQLRDALADADTPFETSTVDGIGVAVATDRRPDCVVVAESDAADGRAALGQALDRFDVPVVAFVIGFDEAFVVDAKSMGATDVISVPATGDGVFPDAVAGRIERAATAGRSSPSKAAVLDALLENYPHQLYVKNRHHQHEIVSRAIAETYELPREQLRGLTDYELVGESAPELHAEEREIMRTGEPLINDVERYVGDDGRERWVSTTKAPRYEDGDVVGIVGSARDVTDQKRREAKLNALHAASRELVAAQTTEDICAVAIDISDGVPELPPVQLLLAVGGELTPAESDSDAVTPARDPTHETLFDVCHERGRAMTLDAAGERGPLNERGPADELDAVALPLGTHGVLGLVAEEPIDEVTIELADVLAANLKVALDRADREEALARQNEQLEEFAQIVSHDLRNPLSVAQGYLDLLDTDGDVIDEIGWALDRMESLIEELLTLAKNGQVVSETSLLSVPEIAREAWQHVDTGDATLFVQDHQPWTSTRSPPTNRIHADRDRLLELLENLFRNSVEHGGEGLTITVGTTEAGFYVEDDGAGIPDEQKAAVFGQGYTTAEDGTGFGLYIVETLAEAHGWTVSIEDANESETGARFEIQT